MTFSSQLLATDNVNASTATNTIELLDQHLKNELGNVVYVDFWASWCIPCRKSFPWMNSIKAQYQAQGLTIISINLDHSRALADEFLKELPANFPVIYDPKGLIARKYQLKGMPSSFIVNRQGQIVSAHVGFNQIKQEAYESEIKTLLNAQ
ncbi:TlpA family protein disulfide reductase [Colwellia sp. 6M3]|uniref:TlpA disulfide reductase family protein n=1 Tax=Colwellia sp. 6M3 TaxID=2759849 RepID=UPI0015F73313|nr:TlpA disulfide reductase family protein [Colwellia sp. 6M3]MBA6415541.1 TlpA family protein disulfide reductase [Colwellia sp. 6M3]|tara:strand:- start:4250 stop:4702 length:453 start_codon:yes stop_codon:yes gene_type:complete